MQNRCVCFSLKLDKTHYFSEGDSKTINSLLLDYKVHQKLNVTVFKYGNFLTRKKSLNMFYKVE